MANFAISRTGEFLYYADVLGKVISLKLGDLEFENEGEGQEEDAVDDHQKSSGIATSDDGRVNTKAARSIGGTVSLIALTVLVAFSSGVCVMLVLKGKIQNQRVSFARRSKNGDNDPNAGQQATSRRDHYKDVMISDRSISEMTEPTFRLEGGIEVPDVRSFYLHESVRPGPSSRLTPMLGASNRVAPMTEDFSMGAEILV